MRWRITQLFHFDGLISHFKASSFDQIDMTGMTIAPTSKKSNLELVLPILTLSEANGLLSKTRFYKNGKAKPEHWTESHARHKAQKSAIYLALNSQKNLIKLPCVVKMTRQAPRDLDADDNLRIALKWIKDAIAELITGDYVPGRADGDKRIKWEYDQEKCSEYKVKIEISW